MMRSWIVVAIGLAAIATILPATRAVQSVIGDAQIVYALALVILLGRQTWRTFAIPSRPRMTPLPPSAPGQA